jgi:hypothetical protein
VLRGVVPAVKRPDGSDRTDEFLGVQCVVEPRGHRPAYNRRPYDEWDALFKRWFAPGAVTWIKGERQYVSEAWCIDLRGEAR